MPRKAERWVTRTPSTFLVPVHVAVAVKVHVYHHDHDASRRELWLLFLRDEQAVRVAYDRLRREGVPRARPLDAHPVLEPEERPVLVAQ
jgi:hypothetical protein